jgi:hypothetical protein
MQTRRCISIDYNLFSLTKIVSYFTLGQCLIIVCVIYHSLYDKVKYALKLCTLEQIVDKSNKTAMNYPVSHTYIYG